eukprot:9456083-Pyramimonas_sp.AAC.1
MSERQQIGTEWANWIRDRERWATESRVVGNATLVLERAQSVIFGLGAIGKCSTRQRTCIRGSH